MQDVSKFNSLLVRRVGSYNCIAGESQLKRRKRRDVSYQLGCWDVRSVIGLCQSLDIDNYKVRKSIGI